MGRFCFFLCVEESWAERTEDGFAGMFEKVKLCGSEVSRSKLLHADTVVVFL